MNTLNYSIKETIERAIADGKNEMKFAIEENERQQLRISRLAQQLNALEQGYEDLKRDHN